MKGLDFTGARVWSRLTRSTDTSREIARARFMILRHFLSGMSAPSSGSVNCPRVKMSMMPRSCACRQMPPASVKSPPPKAMPWRKERERERERDRDKAVTRHGKRGTESERDKARRASASGRVSVTDLRNALVSPRANSRVYRNMWI
jgi:broad specificity polyphosphatase/5'/3'-nucleotidase SurE